MLRILSLILIFSLLSACVTNIPEPTAPRSDNAAVIQLINEAETLTGNRQFTQAKAKLERALRIEKQNPYVWFALAKTQKLEGNTNQAKNIALRAKSYSTSISLSREIDYFISHL